MELLEIMLSDMETAPSIYRPSNFWSIFIQTLCDEIRENGVSSFRSQKHALQLYVPEYPHSELGRMEAFCDYKVFVAADNSQLPDLTKVSESQIGAPAQQFIFENKHYSKSCLNYLRGLAYLKKTVDTSNIRSILEIGGGFGSLGEIFLKSDSQRHFYVNVDIPPLSYVSTRYLEALFGKENVGAYDVTRDLEEIDLDLFADKYRAMVLLPWQLPRIKGHIDLFVNFFSFQEMEPDIVENYASHINRLIKGHLLMRNQRTGKQIAEKPGEIGVLKPVTRKDYIRFFYPFDMVGIDSRAFGNQQGGFHSEVSVFQRREEYALPCGTR